MPEHNSIEERLGELEARVTRLEQSAVRPHGSANTDRLAAKIEERTGGTTVDTKTHPIGQLDTSFVLLAGGSTLAFDDSTEIEKLLEASDDALAIAISGLAHPVRVRLYKALLTGRKESGELLEIAGLNTTGQLYHHLQAMEDVGLVSRRSRNLWECQNQVAFLHLIAAGHWLSDWTGTD